MIKELFLILVLLASAIANVDQEKPWTAATYLGGSNDEAFWSTNIALDAQGNVFVSGITTSTDFPTSSGAYDVTHNGDKDAFIAKFDPTLKTLLACTLIGGSGEERSCEIAIAKNGDIVIAGCTASRDFPIKDGYDDSHNGGQYDMYIAVLSEDLKTLKSSTYLGGNRNEVAVRRMLVIDDDEIYITSYTESSNYPTTEGSYDQTYNGGGDSVITILTPSLDKIIASTYLGSTGMDWAYPITLTKSHVYIGGHTDSPRYPLTATTYDASYNGGTDCFISALDKDLKTLSASTFFGGSDFDNINSITVDESGDIVVAGHTGSTNFPTTQRAYQSTYRGGERDNFVSRFDADLKTLKASTLIGGTSSDYQLRASLGKEGDILITGATNSDDFPYTEGKGDGTEFTLSILDSQLSKLKRSLQFGGDVDNCFGEALRSGDEIVIAGTRASGEDQFTGFDPTYNGGTDVFVVRIPYKESTPSQKEPDNPQPQTNTGIPSYPQISIVLGVLFTLIIIRQLRQNQC